MTVTNAEYLERFLEDIDRVMGGRPGAVSDDRWLVNNYDPDKLRVVTPYLDFEDPRVRAEVITLLGNVRERGAYDKILGMRDREGDLVSMACLGYLSTLREDDEAAPYLLDIMDHARGDEFVNAARRLAGIARSKDMPRVRKIYGQVGGSMRDETRVVIERIISRDPELAKSREFLVSVPVYPDETKFERFLDSSIEYLDVRYRKNVLPKAEISSTTFNNIARAIKKMRIRLYNEADNLQFYGPDKEDRFHELSGLIKWASEDIGRKTVIASESPGKSRMCPGCGGMLVCYKGIWMCPDCGGDLRSSSNLF